MNKSKVLEWVQDVMLHKLAKSSEDYVEDVLDEIHFDNEKEREFARHVIEHIDNATYNLIQDLQIDEVEAEYDA
jgi:phage gp16-like protein